MYRRYQDAYSGNNLNVELFPNIIFVRDGYNVFNYKKFAHTFSARRFSLLSPRECNEATKVCQFDGCSLGQLGQSIPIAGLEQVKTSRSARPRMPEQRIWHRHCPLLLVGTPWAGSRGHAGFMDQGALRWAARLWLRGRQPRTPPPPLFSSYVPFPPSPISGSALKFTILRCCCGPR